MPSSFKAIYHLRVAQIEFSRSLVLIQSCNRYAIRANVNKPSDANNCDANDLYEVKRMTERKLC